MPEVREVDGFGDVKQGDCGSTGRWGVQRSRPYGRKRQWMRKLRLDAFYFGFPRAVGWSGLVWWARVRCSSKLLGGKQRVLDRRMVLTRPPSRWIEISIVRQRAEAMIWKTGSYRRGPTSQSRR